jgi:hypothetical protein
MLSPDYKLEAGLEFSTAFMMKIVIFWLVALNTKLADSRRFEGTFTV